MGSWPSPHCRRIFVVRAYKLLATQTTCPCDSDVRHHSAVATMASFLSSISNSFTPAASSVAPVAASVRVLVIGDQNAGKTALSELIVTRKPPKSSLKSTAGCSVSVALFDADDAAAQGSSGGGALAQWGDAAKGSSSGGRQKFFVEIWDVSANPYYEQVRRPGPRGREAAFTTPPRAAAPRVRKPRRAPRRCPTLARPRAAPGAPAARRGRPLHTPASRGRTPGRSPQAPTPSQQPHSQSILRYLFARSCGAPCTSRSTASS